MYRIIPVHSDDYHLLKITWKHSTYMDSSTLRFSHKYIPHDHGRNRMGAELLRDTTSAPLPERFLVYWCTWLTARARAPSKHTAQTGKAWCSCRRTQNSRPITSTISLHTGGHKDAWTPSPMRQAHLPLGGNTAMGTQGCMHAKGTGSLFYATSHTATMISWGYIFLLQLFFWISWTHRWSIYVTTK